MKILVASVTNRSAEVLGPHIASVKALEIPKDVEVSLAYVSDGLDSESKRVLLEAGAEVLTASPKPSDASYAVTETSHEWNVPTFQWLAYEKQRLLDLAIHEGFDRVFFVDSDLILGPETLASLISCAKPIVSAVFWTSWNPGTPPLPQVWLTHPYEFQGRSGTSYLSSEDFLKRLGGGDLLEVGGLGACTLIDAEVLDRVRFFPLLDGLPSGGMWQGEDRSFCLRATRAHIPLFADAWPDIFHVYRPSDVERIDDAVDARLTRVSSAEIGDFVSVILEPLEEAELATQGFRHHLRGRLGTFRILPEIEAALREMSVGEERIVKVSFPLWWKLETYRGTSKAVLVRLLDVKRS